VGRECSAVMEVEDARHVRIAVMGADRTRKAGHFPCSQATVQLAMPLFVPFDIGNAWIRSARYCASRATPENLPEPQV
jgi:hypothetical protein